MAYNTDDGTWKLIEEQELGSGAVSITFSTIPQTYRHLQLKASIRTDKAGVEQDAIYLRFNADSGNNYDRLICQLFPNSVGNAGNRASTSGYIARGAAATALGSSFSPLIIEFPFYKNTNFHKWALSQEAQWLDVSADADARYHLFQSRRRNTEAITSITLFTSGADDFITSCIFDLYGQK